MLRPIHAHEHQAAHLGHVRQGRSVNRAEAHVVAVHCLDIGMLRQDPHAWLDGVDRSSIERLPKHGRFDSEPSEHFVWEATGVQLRIREVKHAIDP
jgi:hypothetical protein